LARRSCDVALAAGELAIPTVVLFEIGWGLRRGSIEGPADVRAWRNRILSLGVREVGLSAEIAMTAVGLDDLHGDPFDRIIVATAMSEEAVLLTADRPLLAWSGQLRRQDARR
jgi:PIN domain nuclease of toxin-antitoxin system